MPIFLFQPASAGTRQTLSEKKRQMDFREVVSSYCDGLPRSARTETAATLDLYGKLHRIRVAYDTYEYFGFYAFARHLLILRTTELIERIDARLASRFHHAASLYEYHQVPGLLGLMTSEAPGESHHEKVPTLQ